MKTFIKLLFVSVLLTSCSSEENTTIETADSTLEQAIDQIKSISVENDQAVEFTISTLDDGSVRLGEPEIVPDSRFDQDFLMAFNISHEFKVFGKNIAKSTTVCCQVEGEDPSCEECGNNDGACILIAIKACLSADGCAEVCENKIRYIPSLDIYLLTK